MMRMTLRMACVMVVCTVALSCTKASEAPPLKELQRAKSGDLEIVLLASSDALKAGKDQAFLEFRKTPAGLVDVGTVTVNATMPMAGMSPMMGSSFVNKTDTPGRYAIDTDLSMAGLWRLEVVWNGPAGSGKVTLPGAVR